MSPAHGASHPEREANEGALGGPAAASRRPTARPTVRLERVEGRPAVPPPTYHSELAAGADLHAATRDPLTVMGGEVILVPTGWRLALPEGWEAQVRPRSGLAFRHGVTVANAPGTIDADYRGELCVLLTKLTPGQHVIAPGERIAQLVVAPVARAHFEEGPLPPTPGRGEGGFGSTGTAPAQPAGGTGA